jgi:chaperonin GroEL
VALPDRDEDKGAMLLRGLLWRLHDQFGDGTATAAVLFQSIFNQGVQHVTAGGDPMRLRQALDKSLPLILDQMAGMRIPVRGKGPLTRMAAALCYDEPLAKMLGEVFDTIGEYGQLEIREGNNLAVEREYVEGSNWGGGVLAREMIADKTRLKTVLEKAAVLISDLTVEDPAGVETLIQAAVTSGAGALLIVASQFSAPAMAMLRTPRRGQPPLPIVAVKTPGPTLDDQIGALEDLAILTGGQPLLSVIGQSLAQVTPEHLGRARVAWADRFYFGIVAGRGNPRALRQHLLQLKAALQHAQDKSTREVLQKRLGKLLGGSATVSIGAATPSSMKVRKELAERTAAALRGALLEGALPGGGAALVACRPALQQRLKQSTDPDERAACRILMRALEAPMRAIIGNAGGDASPILAAVERGGPACGFDVVSGQLVNTVEAGILDVATVLKAAIQGAITTAGLGLTIDVLIHQRKRQTVLTPR